MKLREATLADVPAAAKVGTEAFAQDPSYAHFYPWKEQYPDDFYRQLLHNYKKSIVTPGTLMVLVELDKADLQSAENSNGPKVGDIVGYAIYRRSGGTKAEHDKWSADSASKRFHRFVLTISTPLSSLLRPNRAISHEALSSFWSQAFAVHATTSFTGKLDALTLAVHPAYQRQGVGEKLIAYSACRCAEERIPIFADATQKGLKLYLRNGCLAIGEVVLDEKVYEKRGGKMKVKREKLVTPVIRWDLANVTEEWLGLAQAAAGMSKL